MQQANLGVPGVRKHVRAWQQQCNLESKITAAIHRQLNGFVGLFFTYSPLLSRLGLNRQAVFYLLLGLGHQTLGLPRGIFLLLTGDYRQVFKGLG